MTEIAEGEIFGEVYACMENIPAAVNAQSVRESKVIKFGINKIMHILFLHIILYMSWQLKILFLLIKINVFPKDH